MGGRVQADKDGLDVQNRLGAMRTIRLQPNLRYSSMPERSYYVPESREQIARRGPPSRWRTAGTRCVRKAERRFARVALRIRVRAVFTVRTPGGAGQVPNLPRSGLCGFQHPYDGPNA